MLDGAYYTSEGPIVWTGFKGDRYVTWSSDPSCNDPETTPPDSCAQSGTFVLDAQQGQLTLTDEGGQASTLRIDIKQVQSRSSLTVDSVSPRAGLIVRPPTELIKTDVVTRYALYEPSSEPLVQQVGLREGISMCLLVATMLHPDMPTRGGKFDHPSPPPVVSVMSDCPKPGPKR